MSVFSFLKDRYASSYITHAALYTGRKAGRTGYGIARLGGKIGRAAYRHPAAIGLPLTIGTLSGGTVAASLISSGATATREFNEATQAEYMTNLILNAQAGPLGPGGRMLGIQDRHANTAGLTLAAHYAKNRNKYFGMTGLRFL